MDEDIKMKINNLKENAYNSITISIEDDWRSTFEYRHNLIKEKKWEINQIFEEWEILKQPTAIKLMTIDYDCLKLPQVTLNYENWKDFIDFILEEEEIKSGEISSLKKQIESEQFNDGIY